MNLPFTADELEIAQAREEEAFTRHLAAVRNTGRAQGFLIGAILVFFISFF